MKYATKILIALLALMVCVGGSVGYADQFLVTADIPAATGVSITATKNQVVGGAEQFGPSVTQFDFNPMNFDSVNGIFLPPHFFAVDVAATGGAGAPDVTVSYGSEVNPIGQAKGLGSKATITFSKVSGGPDPADQTDATMAGHGPTKLLSQIAAGEQITKTELQGGFLRLRVGIFDGADQTLISAGGEPFTNADLPGTYNGVITVTATVL